MRSRVLRGTGLLLFFIVSFTIFLRQLAGGAEGGVKLHVDASSVVVSWPAGATDVNGQAIWPQYVLERSPDLKHWNPVTGPLRGFAGRTDSSFSYQFPRPAGPQFYRVRADLSPEIGTLGEGGAEIFGYAEVLKRELEELGLLDLGVFTNMYPLPQYAEALSFDPFKARYWTNFATNPAEWNANLPPGSPDRRLTDFRLNNVEREYFRTNGFVVSRRLGSQTVGGVYYNLWTDDMPVLITTDSILQAWHRSFENMLMEVEEMELYQALVDSLSAMTESVQGLRKVCEPAVQPSLNDVDYFCNVGLALLGAPSVPSPAVAETLRHIEEAVLKRIEIFGSERDVDFSQFVPRGHYTKSERLQRYFKAMMWCGQIDLRFASFPPNSQGEAQDLRQLTTALAMTFASAFCVDEDTNVYVCSRTKWNQMERVLSALIGPPDSMNISQLREAAKASGIRGPLQMRSEAIRAFRESMLTGELGTQQILSYPIDSPLSPEQVRLPLSFTVMGQRFTMDSWAMGQVVFDRVIWPTNNPAIAIYGKVLRRKPSSLDIAFTVLGNNSAVPDLASRILGTGEVRFRDGFPYQHNLAAVRRVIDAQSESVWTQTGYARWLSVLRTLSTPASAVGNAVPEAMKTRAWAMKDLNTQLAGWTQLRHDTILYAKQSYTPPLLCEYPDGFVEPRPEFFRQLGALASSVGSAMQETLGTGTLRIKDPDDYGGFQTIEVSIGQAHINRAAFLSNFRGKMEMLAAMAEKELRQEPFAPEQTSFIKSMMENTKDYLGVRQYSGWYPQLFYKSAYYGYNFHKDAGCDYPDGLVVDVHTDLPDEVVGDPGAVIHNAIGNFNLLVIAVNNGSDTAVYAGPVLSHYEFEKPSGVRMTDEQWKAVLMSPALVPPDPPWTKLYMP